MQLFYVPQIKDQLAIFDEEEAHHCVQVLRKREGDLVQLVDGRGGWYEALIAETGKRRCVAAIQRIVPQEHPRRPYLHLAVAPTKNIERTEWLFEKITEIGVDEITLLLCRHSERRQVRLDRLRKVLVSAMKQSLQATLPKLNDLTPFEKVVHEANQSGKYIAYCDSEIAAHELKDRLNKSEDTLVLIGPEGDFSPEEAALAMEKGFVPVSLGPNRLRTETAGLVAVHTVNLLC
jgi:16S rRNA (uracil1498-N3)-methyltransferase